MAEARGGGLIAVFGSAGERDAEKRPMMGRVAAERSRLVIVTDEDPRDEDPRPSSRPSPRRGGGGRGPRRGRLADPRPPRGDREAIRARATRRRRPPRRQGPREHASSWPNGAREPVGRARRGARTALRGLGYKRLTDRDRAGSAARLSDHGGPAHAGRAARDIVPAARPARKARGALPPTALTARRRSAPAEGQRRRAERRRAAAATAAPKAPGEAAPGKPTAPRPSLAAKRTSLEASATS